MGRLEDAQANLNAKAARMRERDAQRRDDRRAAPTPATAGEPSPDAAERSPEIRVVSYKKLADYEKDARKRAKTGWRVETHVEQERRVAKGRTLGKTVLTGGVGLVLTGRSKKGDAITITWIR